jgi:hypothetical protein
MKRLVATLLTGLALSGPALAADYGASVVSRPQDCPAGTAAHVPAYEWRDGHFVQSGWTCETIYDPSP